VDLSWLVCACLHTFIPFPEPVVLSVSACPGCRHPTPTTTAIHISTSNTRLKKGTDLQDVVPHGGAAKVDVPVGVGPADAHQAVQLHLLWCFG
jgi:hypothetical protein